MIAAGFWGVKVRKPQHRRGFADGPRAPKFYGDTCTRFASCVKFNTNQSFARLNRKAKVRETVPSHSKV